MRLTKARTERWTDQLDKAMSIIAKVEAEQRSYYNTAKGGRLQDLTVALGASRDAVNATKAAAAANESLVLGEIRRSR